MYGVYWTSKAFNHHRIGPPAMIEGSLTESFAEALVFAEVLVAEHSERIDTDYLPMNDFVYDGFVFVTNNGSTVWYTVMTPAEAAKATNSVLFGKEK